MLTSSFEFKNIFLKILKRWIYSSILILSYLIFIEIFIEIFDTQEMAFSDQILFYIYPSIIFFLFFFLLTFNFIFGILEMMLIL